MTIGVLRAGLVLASGSLAIAMGCASFSAADAADGGGAEAGAPADAADAADAGLAPTDAAAPCVNLIVNPGFEEPADCRPWTNYGGPATGGTPAKSGGNACRACTSDGKDGRINLVVRLAGQTFAPGEVVHFEAWTRASDGKLIASSSLLIGYTDIVSGTSSTEFVLTSAYQRISIDYVIPLDGGPMQTPSFQFLVSRPTDVGDQCILMDDVSACRAIDGG